MSVAFSFCHEASNFRHSQARTRAQYDRIAMSSESLNGGRPVYERFLLLLLGEAITGFFLLWHFHVYAYGGANGNRLGELGGCFERHHLPSPEEQKPRLAALRDHRHSCLFLLCRVENYS